MQFISDQDVYWVTIKKLREWGHEVTTVRDLGMHKSSDDDLLDKARILSKIFLTRDKDFGTLTFLKDKISAGIIFLRCSPTNLDAVHQELNRLLLEHDEEELKRCFSVVEPNRYRLRRLGSE
jgi:predicted nuclease of predicted toxin-antitoxin system